MLSLKTAPQTILDEDDPTDGDGSGGLSGGIEEIGEGRSEVDARWRLREEAEASELIWKSESGLFPPSLRRFVDPGRELLVRRGEV